MVSRIPPIDSTVPTCVTQSGHVLIEHDFASQFGDALSGVALMVGDYGSPDATNVAVMAYRDRVSMLLASETPLSQIIQTLCSGWIRVPVFVHAQKTTSHPEGTSIVIMHDPILETGAQKVHAVIEEAWSRRTQCIPPRGIVTAPSMSVAKQIDAKISSARIEDLLVLSHVPFIPVLAYFERLPKLMPLPTKLH